MACSEIESKTIRSIRNDDGSNLKAWKMMDRITVIVCLLGGAFHTFGLIKTYLKYQDTSSVAIGQPFDQIEIPNLIIVGLSIFCCHKIVFKKCVNNITINL